MDLVYDHNNNIGEIFQNQYKLLGKIGQGSFGQVHKAQQITTNQEVAIKILRLQHGDEAPDIAKQIARFQHETQLYAQLYHPNIVRMIDSGQASEKLLYIVFEFIPGRNLSDVLTDEKTLHPVEAIHLMSQVLDALHCAHDQGLVHRDLKPDNIMITSTGARRNALILDFGIGFIAKQDPTNLPRARLTTTYETMGSPAYVAPEQLRGETLSARTDLYAWGLVFLECLTGECVMQGKTVAEVLYKQLGSDPVPIPETIQATKIGQLLQQVTQKEITKRDVTALDLLRELEAITLSEFNHSSSSSAHQHFGDLVNRAVLPTSHNFIAYERRQITILCCNLLISEHSLESPPIVDEILDERINQYFNRYNEIAQQFNASIAGTFGNRILFYFGYPIAQEDSVQCAAQMALSILSIHQQDVTELPTENGLGLDVCMGIHTGLVTQSSHGPITSGITPTLAAQISEDAAANSILTSEVTQHLLDKGFAFSPPITTELAGKTALLFPLLGRIDKQLAEDITKPLPIPMIGRTQELDSLIYHWQQTLSGEGRNIIVVGEAGIGKSRLTAELAEQINTTCTWLECRCLYENRNRPLRPIIELLEQRLADYAKDSNSALLQLLGEYGFDLSTTVPLFADFLAIPLPEPYKPLDVSPQRGKELLMECLIELLLAIADQRPTLLLLEDLHWADPSTLEFFSLLVDQLSDVPLLTLLTTRPETQLPKIINNSNILQLQLSRLSKQQTEEMVLAVSKGKTLPEETITAIMRRTDGIPLFIEELTDMLLHSEILQEHVDHYTLSGSIKDLEIPFTLRDLLTSKLDKLGRAKESVQLAAALGREFEYDWLSAVSPLDTLSLDQDLETLFNADLIRRRRRNRTSLYVFKHALIRDAAYESMPIQIRRQTHQLIATTLERSFADLVEQRPDLLSQHYAAAELKLQALHYIQKAGAMALHRSADNEAINYVEQGLNWLPSVADPKQKANIELSLNCIATPALMAAQGYSAADLGKIASRSLELVDIIDETEQVFPALWGLAIYHHARSERPTTFKLIKKYIAMAERLGDADKLIAGLPFLAQCYYLQGDSSAAKPLLKRAISLYDFEKQKNHGIVYGIDSLALAHMILGQVLWVLGDLEQALTNAMLAVNHSKKLQHKSTISIATLYHIMLYQRIGDKESVIRLAEENRELCQKYGLSGPARYTELLYHWATGDTTSAYRVIEQHRSQQSLLGLLYYLGLIAESEAAHNNYQKALAIIDSCLAEIPTLQEYTQLPRLYYLKGVFLHQQDSSANREVEKNLQQSLKFAREQQSKTQELLAANYLCKLWLKNGNYQSAQRLFNNIYRQFTEGFDIQPLVSAKALVYELSKY